MDASPLNFCISGLSLRAEPLPLLPLSQFISTESMRVVLSYQRARGAVITFLTSVCFCGQVWCLRQIIKVVV